MLNSLRAIGSLRTRAPSVIMAPHLLLPYSVTLRPYYSIAVGSWLRGERGMLIKQAHLVDYSRRHWHQLGRAVVVISD